MSVGGILAMAFCALSVLVTFTSLWVIIMVENETENSENEE